jgi:5-methylcytosine-specific restriction protein A
MAMTKVQLDACYEVANQVAKKKVRPEAGATTLHAKYGIAKTSARILISDFVHMREGSGFTRSISIAVAEHQLGRIEADFGADGLANAIWSVQQYIVYYEGKRKIRLEGLRGVVDSFASRLKWPVDLQAERTEFEKRVDQSMRDSSAARKARLKGAPKLPAKILVTTYVYARNRDVVAETLLRAKGRCEGCNEIGPFKRRGDGTRYLEVHHKKQLSAGGEDTVKNAIALCPNCHRERHFG